MTKKPYTFRLDEQFIEEELRPIAVKENRPLTNLIETILLTFVKKRKSKQKKE